MITLPPRIGIASNVYYEDLYAGVAAYAREHHWDVDTTMLRSSGYTPKRDDWVGILAIVTLESTARCVFEQKCPVVELVSPYDSARRNPVVACDYHAIGGCGARHLLELGDVRFGFYRYFDGPESTAIRDGYVSELDAHGLEVIDFAFGMPTVSPGYRHTTRLERVAWLVERLRNCPMPLAVMAEDDRFSVDLVMAARALGLRVPEDIAILGADDHRLLHEMISDELSSVDANLREIGWRGAELLDRLLQGAEPGSPDVPMITKVQPKGILVRQSTAMFACSHPGVTAAAIFIRGHFREAITVADVAAKAGMSLRALQAEYPAHVGLGVREDILRHRITAAQSLLERSDLKLSAVASESGLDNAEKLCRVFQRELGVTPHAWRLQKGNQVGT